MLLEMINVSKSFNERLLYKAVNIEINEGDKACIVGLNGQGKSTLIKMMIGVESPDTGSVNIEEGVTVSYLEQVGGIDESMIVRDILNIPFEHIIQLDKDIKEMEIELGVTDNVEDLLEQYQNLLDKFESIGGYDYVSEQEKFINAFELRGQLEQPFSTLSGGERQFVRLALTIFADNDLIILDEPLTFFDKAKISFLSNYIQQSTKSFVVISHDLSFVRVFANKIIDVDNFTTKVYECNYKEYINQKLEYLKEIELQNSEIDEKIQLREKRIEQKAEWRDRAENAYIHAVVIRRLEREIARMEKNKIALSEQNEYGFDITPNVTYVRENVESDEVLVQITDANLKFGDRIIYKNANLKLMMHEHICIIGKNGMGKTTLFRVINGEQKLDSGEVYVNDKSEVSFVAQEVLYDNDKLTVFDYCKQETLLGDIFLEDAICNLFDDKDFVVKRLYMLSGGERKRLQIFLKMLSKPNLLLIDEPTTFMDEYSTSKIIELIQGFEGGVILVTHDKLLRKLLGVKTYNLNDYKFDEV